MEAITGILGKDQYGVDLRLQTVIITPSANKILLHFHYPEFPVLNLLIIPTV